jgi:rare lipoprotein A
LLCIFSQKKIFFLCLSFFSCFHVLASEVGDTVVAAKDTVLFRRMGSASYYAKRFHGRRTSCGHRLDNYGYTCAHSNLPFGTLVRVTNQRNKKSVVVKVMDRFGPGAKHLVDITWAAACDIDMIRDGVAKVMVEVLNPSIGEMLLPKDSLLVALPVPLRLPFCPTLPSPCYSMPETVAIPR